MIFLLNDSILNQQCAALLADQLSVKDIKVYPALSFDKSEKSDSLVIVDIANQFFLTSHFTPEKFADYLMQSGLPKEITNIYFIMQDMDTNDNLIVYAQDLAKYFLENHQRKMSVHIPSELGYDMTLLLPSDNNQGMGSVWHQETKNLNKTCNPKINLERRGSDSLHE